jgi:2-C-methyl-D-erythritol 4-phosphate cytidylyltransferase
MRFAVVIPAAGTGSRMGSAVPKVLLPISTGTFNCSILQRTVTVFADDLDCIQIVVCVPRAWRQDFERALEGIRAVSIVEGGDTRQDSVRRGIEYLASLEGASAGLPVLVHDAARCCVTSEVVSRVVQGVEEYGAVTAAVRVLDSTCRVDSAGQIADYVDRKSLWSVQTPQGFLLGDLVRAHRDAERYGISALDDASLVARIRPVRAVVGDRLNIKVTEPGDLKMAEAFLDSKSLG